jgi:hypothetical protein
MTQLVYTLLGCHFSIELCHFSIELCYFVHFLDPNHCQHYALSLGITPPEAIPAAQKYLQEKVSTSSNTMGT